jgi:hypothetical protein
VIEGGGADIPVWHGFHWTSLDYEVAACHAGRGAGGTRAPSPTGAFGPIPEPVSSHGPIAAPARFTASLTRDASPGPRLSSARRPSRRPAWVRPIGALPDPSPRRRRKREQTTGTTRYPATYDLPLGHSARTARPRWKSRTPRVWCPVARGARERECSIGQRPACGHPRRGSVVSRIASVSAQSRRRQPGSSPLPSGRGRRLGRCRQGCRSTRAAWLRRWAALGRGTEADRPTPVASADRTHAVTAVR